MIRFTLDSTHLDIPSLCRKIQRKSAYTGPSVIGSLSCVSCRMNLMPLAVERHE